MTIISYVAHVAGNSPASAVKNVISLDMKDPKDHSKDELYINFDHISRANWKYITPRYHFEYKQDAHFGSIQLDKACHVGTGKMRINDVEHPVKIAMGPFQYTIDRAWGKDCGAYVTGAGLELIWDTSSDEWQNAVFDKDEIMFEYWYDGGTQARVKFTYIEGNIEWQPDRYVFIPVETDRGPQMYFGAYSQPPSPLKYFPFKQSFEFNISETTILGGASLHYELSVFGDVYGIKGKIINPPKAVGTYHLSKDGLDAGVLKVHAIDLNINGLCAKNFKISGNKITWEGSNEAGHLPQHGFVDISDDGNQITGSSLGVTGTRHYNV